MGLATLLKRRLGRDEDQGANKRRQSAAISSQAALDITPEALAALKAKNTRTARRKLAKLGPLADEILARAAAKDSGHGDGAGSDDEGFNKGAVPGAGAAYDALLASLASGSDAVAEAYQQRRRELDGYSDESESDADEEDGEGTATEEEEGSEGSDAQGSEELGGGVHGGRSNGKRTANGRSSNSEVAEEEVPSEDSEGEEEEDGDASEDEAKNDASAASAFDSLAADRYAAHFEDQISEDEVAALAASTSGTRTFAEAPSCVQEWKPEAVVQVSEGGQLPDNIPTDLRQYGVKERLATRWKEVHGNGVEEAGPGSKCTGKAQRGVGDFVTEKQRALFGLLTSYADVLHPCRPYPTSPGGRTLRDGSLRLFSFD